MERQIWLDTGLFTLINLVSNDDNLLGFGFSLN